MKENFPKALAYVLQSEGGNDDDPDDHGGRTSRGITQREYDAWRKEQGMTPKDVWKADQDEIEDIYHDEYWGTACDLLPTGIDYLYFDMAVNAGPHRATVLLQRALGVNDDGRVGPITRNAIKNADPRQLIDDFSDVKAQYYKTISILHARTNPGQRKFLKGWLNRVEDVRGNALAMLPTPTETA